MGKSPARVRKVYSSNLYLRPPMDKTKMNIDEIVIDLAKSCFETEDDIKTFVNYKEETLRMMHHGFGTFIRNTYSLWYENPLTENWRTNEVGRNIINNVDHSDDHPDAISMDIIYALHKHMKEQHG